MKKIFCLFAFMFALTPSFAQNEENRDSVTISNFYKELEAQKVTEICGIKFGTSYEDAKRILANKYGEAYKYSKQSIIFNYIIPSIFIIKIMLCNIIKLLYIITNNYKFAHS